MSVSWCRQADSLEAACQLAAAYFDEFHAPMLRAQRFVGSMELTHVRRGTRTHRRLTRSRSSPWPQVNCYPLATPLGLRPQGTLRPLEDVLGRSRIRQCRVHPL